MTLAVLWRTLTGKRCRSRRTLDGARVRCVFQRGHRAIGRHQHGAPLGWGYRWWT